MAFVDQQDPFCKIVTCIDAWDRCYPVLFWVVALHRMIVSSLFVGQGLMGATVASFLIYLWHQLNLRCLDGKSVDGQHSQALNNCKESIFCLWSRPLKHGLSSTWVTDWSIAVLCYIYCLYKICFFDAWKLGGTFYTMVCIDDYFSKGDHQIGI